MDSTKPPPPRHGSPLVGKVRDLDPNREQPRLELYFDQEDADRLPRRHADRIGLTIEGVRWVGTIGIKPANPPYLHADLESPGAESSVTERLRSLGVREGGRLHLERTSPGELGLIRVLDRGQWREGNERGVRALF